MKKVILTIISFFLLINTTKALTIDCPSIASPTEIITCNINETEYIGIKANYQSGELFIYKDLSITSWKKYYSSKEGFSLGNIKQESLSATLDLQVSKDIKVNNNYELVLSNIEVVDKNYQNIKLDNITSNNIKVVSNINTLKKLEVNNENLTPRFNSNTTEYSLNTYNDQITIKATPTDEESNISGDIGTKKLEYGANTFVITVTSVRGEEKNYYIYVTREIKKNNDITLKSLSISPGKIEFNKNKYIYTIDVDYNVEDIKIEAVPNNNKSTIKIEKPNKLVVGKNNITIIVTAEDGTIGKYSIIVNRKNKLSNDATIKKINISNYDLNFKSDIYEYELRIEKEEKLEIEVLLNDSNSKYSIEGNNNLKNNSIILIKVTAQDGTIKEYKIKIIKSINIEEPKNEVKTEEETSIDKDDKLTSKENNNSILEQINLTPIVAFIILILIIIILKVINDIKKKKNK